MTVVVNSGQYGAFSPPCYQHLTDMNMYDSVTMYEHQNVTCMTMCTYQRTSVAKVLVVNASDKALFSHPGAILVDDRAEYRPSPQRTNIIRCGLVLPAEVCFTLFNIVLCVWSVMLVPGEVLLGADPHHHGSLDR